MENAHKISLCAVPCCIIPFLVPGPGSLGTGVVFHKALAGQGGLLCCKIIMAGPEKKVGLEREMLLKQCNEDMMKCPGYKMF